MKLKIQLLTYMKPMFPLGVMLYVFTVTTITVTLGQCSAEGN